MKGGDLKLVIILFIKIYLGCNLKEKKGLCANVSLGLYLVQHFSDEPDAQHVA
jgi:hypothetical protein